MDWYPHAPLTAFHACRRHFLVEKRDTPFNSWQFQSTAVNISSAYRFSKTPDTCGTQIHADKWLIVVLSSHLDLIGDQNDVQHLCIYCAHSRTLYMWQMSVCRLALGLGPICFAGLDLYRLLTAEPN